jgi:large subunit ribosomal protein L10
MKPAGKSVRAEKRAFVGEIRDVIDRASCLFLAECGNLKVADTQELKGRLRKSDAAFKVVKNTMLRQAVLDEPYLKELERALTGRTALVSADGDATEIAKILRTFAKETDRLSVKAGVLDGRALSERDVDELAQLPSKEEMQAKVVGTLAAPMMQLVGVMNQKLCSLVYVLKAVQEKKEAA